MCSHVRLLTVVKTCGEVQEKAIKELLEKVQVLEEGMKDFLPMELLRSAMKAWES